MNVSNPQLHTGWWNNCKNVEAQFRWNTRFDSLQQAAGSCGIYVEQPNPLGILDGGLTQSQRNHWRTHGIHCWCCTCKFGACRSTRKLWSRYCSRRRTGTRFTDYLRRPALRNLCMYQSIPAPNAWKNSWALYRR